MTDTVFSKNGILIRLPAERWAHIIEEHCELAGLKFEVLEAVSSPSKILMGNMGELLASKCSGGWVSKAFRSNPNQVVVL